VARSQSTDYLHNMRFQVETSAPTGVPGDITSQAAPGSGPEAGFSNCSIPEATVEAVEYKEGQFLYTRKYPGNVTFGDVTLSRGVALVEGGFWLWIATVIMGTAEYRMDVTIKHYHRTNVTTTTVDSVLPGIQNPPTDLLLDSGVNAVPPARQYRLYNAFPGRHKFASDLDATDSAVSIMELDLAYESCSLLDFQGNVVGAT
jgi:phage tail-like protein